MGNEVVALEDKSYSVVSVNVPVSVLIILGASATDNKVTGGVMVEAANQVQKRGLSATGGTENRNKFLVSEGQVNAL